MTGYMAVKYAISEFNENELVFANRLYREKLYGQISESNYYKVLERMCKAGELVNIAKGTYHIPKMSKYGIIPPSEKEIIAAFTENEAGTVVGYSLYNELNLTTQISKTVSILSAAIESLSKTIRNVVVCKVPLVFSEEMKNMVHALEVLQNFNKIQDLNYFAFIQYTEKIASDYSDEMFKELISCKKYKKSTIAFLQEILNYYKVTNNLDAYLSTLSEYKHPRMEALYEAARISE